MNQTGRADRTDSGLQLEPAEELKFKGPFDVDDVSVALTIRNPTSKRIAFKIMTTAPDRFRVKPGSGVLDSSQSTEVEILLLPFNYDPREKKQEKFLVQYFYLNETEMSMILDDILNMWKDLPRSRLLELKLKCVFEFTEAEQQRLRISQLNSSSTSSSGPQSKDSPATVLAHTTQQDTLTDNLPNELKIARQEIEQLKKENSRLKNEELRLRRLALLTPAANTSQQDTLIDNLLNEIKLAHQEIDQLKKDMELLKQENMELTLNGRASNSRNTCFIQQLDEFI